MVAGID